MKVGDNKINQSQFFEFITGKELSWQSIIYDLIKTEQLDPWDINIGVLANRYIDIVQQLEEANFFISSKVLLACSLILRLKSEILLNRHLQSINEALYGVKDGKKQEFEKIEIDDEELPLLVPKTPLPRFRRVTLKELMGALNHAIETENRRIKKEIKVKQAEKASSIVLTKLGRVPLGDRIKNIYLRVRKHLNSPEMIKMKYSELAPSREEKISAFLPVLHLTNDEKLYLEQENHFDEIFMMLENLNVKMDESKE